MVQLRGAPDLHLSKAQRLTLAAGALIGAAIVATALRSGGAGSSPVLPVTPDPTPTPTSQPSAGDYSYGGEEPVPQREVPDSPAGRPAPAFALQDQRGRRIDNESLRGRLWLADFVFTRCFNTCPQLTAELGKLRERLRAEPWWDEVKLVSFSVDPAYDDPAVLTRYAEAHHADPDRWLFLTGEPAAVRELVESGFGVGIGEAGDFMPALHSTKVALVDRSGVIRGWYDGLDAADRERLVKALAALAAEPATTRPAGDAAP